VWASVRSLDFRQCSPLCVTVSADNKLDDVFLVMVTYIPEISLWLPRVLGMLYWSGYTLPAFTHPTGRHQRPRWAPEDGGCSGDRIRVIYPVMYKIIGIILAVMPVVLFLRAIFMRSKKRSQAVSEFKKQLDYAVWLILFFIGCAVVYSVGKLIYQFWTWRRVARERRSSLDPGPVAALAPDDLVALLEGALAFAILAQLTLLQNCRAVVTARRIGHIVWGEKGLGITGVRLITE
jgi:hypothetical protein